MKKIMSLLFVCSFVLTINVGCSANNTSSNTSSDTSSAVSGNTNSNTTLNTTGNTSGNLNSGGTVAQQGDWIYYNKMSSGGGLYKVKTDGTDEIKLNDDSAFDINVSGRLDLLL